MPDTTNTRPANQAWREDANLILMASLGRAEDEVNSTPETKALIAEVGLTNDLVMLLRVVMMAAANSTRATLQEAGWMDLDRPKPPLPDAIRMHGEQATAVLARAGLL